MENHETEELVTDFSSLNIQEMNEENDDKESINDNDFKPKFDIIKQKIFQIFNKSCKRIELMERDSGKRIPYSIYLENGEEYVLLVDDPKFPLDEFYSKELMKDIIINEISTINYLDEYTNIPVPKVYYWNVENENELGTPFMITKKLPGNNLEQEWNTFNFEQKCEFVNQFVDFLGTLCDVKQDQIGSLYFDEREKKTFKVGKLVIDNYLNIGRSSLESTVNRGPFNSTKEWLNAAIELEITRYKKRNRGNECKELWVPIQERMLEMFNKYWKDDSDRDYDNFVLCPPFLEDPRKILINKDDKGKIQISGFLEWNRTGFLPVDFIFNRYPHIILNCEELNYSEERRKENLLLQEHFDNQITRKYQLPEQKDEIRKLFLDSIIEEFDSIWNTIDAIRDLHNHFNIDLNEEWLISDDYFKRWFKNNYFLSDNECNRLVDERAWYNGGFDQNIYDDDETSSDDDDSIDEDEDSSEDSDSDT